MTNSAIYQEKRELLRIFLKGFQAKQELQTQKSTKKCK